LYAPVRTGLGYDGDRDGKVLGGGMTCVSFVFVEGVSELLLSLFPLFYQDTSRIRNWFSVFTQKTRKPENEKEKEKRTGGAEDWKTRKPRKENS
jgi:hypothetical protein